MLKSTHATRGIFVAPHHLAAQAGVRYLQCSLCECQWHVVRSKCSNCDSTHALDYWCLEDEKAPIKAESCNECQTYLKAFYQQAGKALLPGQQRFARRIGDKERKPQTGEQNDHQ